MRASGLEAEPAGVDLTDLPLGSLREDDRLHADGDARQCSRCEEPIAEGEVPLCVFPRDESGHVVGEYTFCLRCAFDPGSDRCRGCGCTDVFGCEACCAWAAPGLCSECLQRVSPAGCA